MSTTATTNRHQAEAVRDDVAELATHATIDASKMNYFEASEAGLAAARRIRDAIHGDGNMRAAQADCAAANARKAELTSMAKHADRIHWNDMLDEIRDSVAALTARVEALEANA